MAKKTETPGSNDPEEKEELAEKKVEERVEKKIASTPDPEKAVNIIGDIKKPDPTDKEDVKSYFKEINEKLDRLLKTPETKTEEKPPVKESEPPKPVPWWDKEFI